MRILGQFPTKGGETAELGVGAGTLADVFGGETMGLDRTLLEVFRPEEWVVVGVNLPA